MEMAVLCYLTGNSGAWRLLVPPAAEEMLIEMRTAKSATIERSLHDPRCWDVVFEGGKSTTFSLAVDERQVDRDRSQALAAWLFERVAAR